MAGAVHVEALVRFALDDGVNAAGQQLQVEHALREHAHCSFVVSHEGSAGTDGGDGCLLRGEHDLVAVALRRREAAVDREGSCDVSSITIEFAARIDEYERILGQDAIVLDVMQHAGIGATGDDRRVGVAGGATAAELVRELGFEFVFGHARAAMAHRARVAGAADRGGAAHRTDLAAVLDQTHAVEYGAQVADLARCALAGATLCTHGVQGGGDARIPFTVVAERMPQRAAIGDELWQALLEFADRIGEVDAEGFARTFRTMAIAVPDFALLILFPAEEDALRPVASRHYQYGFRFGETGEVPEVAVEAVGVVRVTVAHTLRGRRDDGDAIADLVGEVLAAGGKRAVRHWGESSRSRAAKRSGVPTSTQRPVWRSPVTIPRGIAASSSGRSFIAAPRGTPAKNVGAKTPMPQ